MAYTARELVTRSWYLSGIVARRLQSITGDQATDGLFLLNALLNWKSVEIDLIPYWTLYDFTAQTGVEEYFIPNLLAVESLTFTIGTVRYATEGLTRTQYFATGRTNNVQSLIGNWYFNRSLGGGKLFVYFFPAANYPMQIMGKFGLTNVNLDTDMSLVYDASYLEYLRYSLAQYMCSEYGILMNPESRNILKAIERQLMYVSPPDLSVKKASILTRGAPLSWAQVNIGQGWTPS